MTTTETIKSSKPPSSPNRPGTRLLDRPEFRKKPKPLTFARTASVADAVAAMSERNYGSVIIVDGENRVEGVLTERDIVKRVVNENRDAGTTLLEDVMTGDPRTAHETDDMLDWLRMMSNERFRRLPVVDDDGRLVQVLTQGDFVSYTWPDLLRQAGQLGRATLARNFQPGLISVALILYPLIVLVVFGLLF